MRSAMNEGLQDFVGDTISNERPQKRTILNKICLGVTMVGAVGLAGIAGYCINKKHYENAAQISVGALLAVGLTSRLYTDPRFYRPAKNNQPTEVKR